MVYWNAEEIQQRGLPPGARHSDRRRNLDIPVWPRNKASVLGLGLSRWATPNQSQEAKESWEENGGHFLLNEWSSGNCCDRGSEDSYSEMVYRSLAPPSFSKIQQKRPRTGLRSILLHHDNASSHTANATIAFLEKTPVKLNDSSSLHSRPGPVWLSPVPEREESHTRTPISQARRFCCCLQWGAKCYVWERVAWLLPEVVPDDAAVYRMSWRVLLKM